MRTIESTKKIAQPAVTIICLTDDIYCIGPRRISAQLKRNGFVTKLIFLQPKSTEIIIQGASHMSQTTRLAWCAAFALAATISLFSAVAPDTIQGSGGPITIQPIMHAAVQIRYGNQVITVDPTGMGGDYNALPKADIVLVTDIHGDHLDPATIAKASKPNATVVAPSAAAAQAKGATVIANGETKTINGVSIEAVPMYNLQRGPSAGQLFHTKGRGNGYVMTVGGKRLYFAGDTECIPEMKALKNIDVAFIPMNLPYTMPPSEAAECVKAFKPKIAYPYHYMGSDLKQFEDALKGSGVEVRIRDWYAK